MERLDNLVSIARRIDEASAEIIDPTCEAIEIAALCQKLAEEFTEALASKSVSVSVNAESPVFVSAKEDLLETVLENLLENASSFSPNGSSIKINITAENGFGVVTIRDSGPGIDQADIERVFDRYFTKRDSNKGDQPDKHFGVGLWIVRRNVEAFGGTVMAANRKNGGLKITLSLPLS